MHHKLGISPLPHIIELDVIKQEKPFVMGRIVDVEKALENLPIRYHDELVIQVTDPLLEWNNISLNLVGVDNKLLVSPTHELPDFEIDISVLSQLLWGYYTVKQAVRYKKIQIYNKAKLKALENIFGDTIPYIYEDY